MDWYMNRVTRWGRFINWIGKADITRPTWHELQKNRSDFQMDHSYHGGGVFVASGTK
ncbi:hypothetical protein [Melghirimyces algeriensis]|uniref:hypothetical protein n=1 Tax=Melghirimyces algeriensis TaxID=910412 RepID=UPI00163DE38C|nr:hypothetical protein [Melghirimyces algeriensis]